MGTVVAGSSISTVRVPELPVATTPALDDELILWQAIDNVTRSITMQDALAFIISGGGTTTTTTIQIGNRFIHIVTAAEDGSTQILIPELAGLIWNMTRGSQPLIPTEEFEILTAGGVKLPQAKIDAGDVWHEGERLIFDVYDYGDSTTIVNNNQAGNLFSGVYSISGNMAIPSSNIGKLGQIRATSAGITAVLPSAIASTGNGVMVFESDITSSKQVKIAGQGGQKIYMGGASYDYVYVSPGEILWLYQQPDGWYVINNFAEIYNQVGDIRPKWKQGLNELTCLGQTVLRADYPRLFEFASSLGSSYVSDATWNTASAVDGSGQNVLKPYKTCFSSGDGSTTFRLPNLSGVTTRGLINGGIGADNERVLNRPGGFQQNQNLTHDHKPANDSAATNYGLIGTSIAGQGTTVGTTDATNSGIEPNVVASPRPMTQNGGVEARMDNIGMIYTIKY